MKKYFLIILLTLLLLSSAAFVQAKIEPLVAYSELALTSTMVSYPDLPGAPKPAAGIPQYIKYIFIFSLSAVGVIALIAMIIAAFQYVTSVGNPQKAAAAKDKIASALLGMLLLLGSYALLNTINPDLLKLKVEAPAVTVEIPDDPYEEEGWGECRYTSAVLNLATINAGESLTLTLYRKNCTKEEAQNHTIDYTVKQVSEAGFGTDLLCKAIVSDAWENENIIENTDTKFVQKFTFNRRCTELKVACKNFSFQAWPICNMQKKQPEDFYLEGKIKIPDKLTQFIPRINIIVIDGK